MYSRILVGNTTLGLGVKVGRGLNHAITVAVASSAAADRDRPDPRPRPCRPGRARGCPLRSGWSNRRRHRAREHQPRIDLAGDRRHRADQHANAAPRVDRPNIEDARWARGRRVLPVEAIDVDAERRQDNAPGLPRLCSARTDAGVGARIRSAPGGRSPRRGRSERPARLLRRLAQRRARQIVDHGVAQPRPGLEHGDAAPAVAAVHDIVVGTVELALERALERLDPATAGRPRGSARAARVTEPWRSTYA